MDPSSVKVVVLPRNQPSFQPVSPRDGPPLARHKRENARHIACELDLEAVFLRHEFDRVDERAD